MSLRKPATNPASKSLRLDEIFGQFRLKGFNALGFPVKLLVENDGSLREQLILWDGTAQQRARSETNGSLIASLYGKAGATLTAVNVETAGELRAVLLGHDGAAIQRIKTETSREVAITNYLKTSTPAVVAARADAAGFQRLREFEPYEGTAVVPIQTTATTIYTVPANTVAVVEVDLVNTDTVSNTYDFHVIASGGSATIGNRMVTTGVLASATIPVRFGPYHLLAGAFLQALVTTVGGANGDINAIAIVKEYGSGDAVALV